METPRLDPNDEVRQLKQLLYIVLKALAGLSPEAKEIVKSNGVSLKWLRGALGNIIRKLPVMEAEVSEERKKKEIENVSEVHGDGNDGRA